MLNRIRLLPTLILCAAALFAIKVVHLGADLVSPAMAQSAPPSPASEEASDKPASHDAAKADGEGAPHDVVALPPQQAPEEAKPMMSPSEIAVLERLSGRREELDQRAKEIDMREQLLSAAEKRVEDRIAELKLLEKKVSGDIGATDQKNEERLASVVKMYETMKPKDAARIFERLDMGVLIDVSKRMEPRKMSAVLAVMDPVAAQELTVELATGAPMGPVQRVPEAMTGPRASGDLPGTLSATATNPS